VWILMGNPQVMTSEHEPSDVIDDGASNVLTEDHIVHVPLAAAELSESIDHHHDSTFVADVPDWDEQDPHA
jgi:hypothetical protein